MNKNIIFDDSKIPGMFDNDLFAFETVSNIIKKEKCLDFVETGTFMGGTSLGIAKAFPNITVWTTESDEILFKNASERFKGISIKSFCGDSVELLKNEIISKLRPRPFFYLDSHVSEYNVQCNPQLIEHYPLKDEILLISSIKELNPIIAIHDFYNPYHPKYSYDKDHGIPLNWDYIKEEIKMVYPNQNPIPYFYNDSSTGNKVGIIYIGVTK